MKRSISTLLFLLVFSLSWAQYSFKFRLNGSVNEKIISLIEEKNGNFLATGYQGTPWDKSDYKGLVIRISPSGDTIVKRYTLSDTTLAFAQIEKSKDSMYYLFGSAFLPPDYKKGLLLMAKMDTGLNLLWYKTYQLPAEWIWPLKTLTVKNRKNFHLFSAMYTENHYWHTMICHLDEYGILKKYAIHNQSNDETVYDAVWSEDSSKFFITGNLLQGYKSSRIVYDTSYNYCFSNVISEEADFKTTVKWFSDSTLVLSANADLPGHDDMLIGFTDTSFTSMGFNEVGADDTTDNVACINSFDFRHHDSIWMLGTHHDQHGFGTPSWISVYQLDSNLIPRSVKYFGGDKYYCSYTLMATSDGGCLLSAVYDDYQGSGQWDVLIMKLKREDFITSSDDMSDPATTEGICIYPNPGRNKISVKTVREKMSLRLFKINGQEVLNLNLRFGDNHIDCSMLPGGTYIYSLFDNNEVIDSGKWVKLQAK